MTDEKQEAMDGSAAIIDEEYIHIQFQCGVIPEVEVNGTTIRRVIELLVQRLTGFQSGYFACIENALAINMLQSAKLLLDLRERDRKKRNVEGKHEA